MKSLKLNLSTFASLLISASLLFFTACDHQVQLPSDQVSVEQEQDALQAKPPKVSWAFGIYARIYRPSRECKRGWGICEITAIFVNFDWNQGIVEIDLGVDTTDDKVGIVYNSNSEEIGAIVANDPFLHIEAGDEVISVDQELLESFGLNEIQLVPGDYEIYLNADNKYQVDIAADLIL